jgi:hypothetical protein
MKVEFTSAERVLFNATVNFAMEYEKLNINQAREKGMNKVLSKRALAKRVSRF